MSRPRESPHSHPWRGLVSPVKAVLR